MFVGFGTEDFEAYLPEKWSSNMFTLPRRKVKDKLETIGRILLKEFEGMDLAPTMQLSDDHPSLWNKKKVDRQWLFFSRNIEAQKELSEIIDTEKTLAATLADPTPFYRHIFLGVSVNSEHLEIALRLHYDAWVDRKNLAALVSSSDKEDAFISLCSRLSEGFELGLSDKESTDARQISKSSLGELLTDFRDSRGWLVLGRRIEKDATAALGSDVEPTILDSIRQLAGLYGFLAWSPANDAVSIDALVAQKKEERDATSAELELERQKREEQRRAKAEILEQRRKESDARILAEQEWRERERAARRAAARAASERRAEEASAASAAPVAAPAKPEVAAVKEAPAEQSGNQAPPASPPREEKKDHSSRPNARGSAPRGSDPRRFDPRRSDSRQSDTRRPDRGPRRDREDSRDRRGGSDRQRREQGKGSFSRGASRPARKPINVSEERKADVQVGDNISVISGFLKGRSGVVQSIDEKGDMKVTFGSMTSRVAKKDIKGHGPSV